jgi:hypothetical protein
MLVISVASTEELLISLYKQLRKTKELRFLFRYRFLHDDVGQLGNSLVGQACKRCNVASSNNALWYSQYCDNKVMNKGKKSLYDILKKTLLMEKLYTDYGN